MISRTVVDLDDQLVAEVAQVLGTSTLEETVDTAPREVLEVRLRGFVLASLRSEADEGALDLGILDTKPARWQEWS